MPRAEEDSCATFEFGRVLRPEQLAHDKQSVTKLLYDRLSEDDVADVIYRASKDPELTNYPAIDSDLDTRRWLVLNYGLWLQVPSVIERTGLRPIQPPEEVHAMARGPLAAGGGLESADLIVDAITSAGIDIADLGDALDFGCSSGRVVRVLVAAFPGLHWHGCDPNKPAIEWAREHLENIEFFVSGQYPPLPLAEGQLGLVYAISIWSHFAPSLGLRWFDEMHRLIRPGGILFLTTHGLQSVSHYAAQGVRSPQHSRAILESLYRTGSWYAAEFGPAGDAGIVNPEWGTAFLSPEWLLTKLCPRWRILEFAPGRNQRNQDVYVLQRT